MDSTLVIKVKYGDTLRRFSAPVDENNQLDFKMVGLKAKICSIFNFPADANFILRYVDEDGDLVNLVDDDDLHDVMLQRLKFLRIDVHMISDCGDKSDAGGTSGSATPLRSPPVSNPFLGGRFVNADALSALPEPLREALYSSLLKAASSSPVLANIADSISKIGQSILNPHCQPHVAGSTSSKNGVPEESVPSEAEGPQSPYVDSACNASDYARSSGTAMPLRSPVPDPFLSGNAVKADVSYSVPEPVHEAFSNLSLSKAASSSHVLPNPADSISKMGKSTLDSHCQPQLAAGPSSKNGVPKEPTTSEARGPQSPFLNSASYANRLVEAGIVLAASNASPQLEAGNVGVAPVDLNILPCDLYSSTNVNSPPLSSAVPGSDDKGKVSIDDSLAGKGERFGKPTNSAASNNRPTKTLARGFGAPIDCPFSGASTLHSMPPPLGYFGIPPFKRSHSHTEAMNGMFHKGVRCDGCGVYPITGPRFKSKIKENYDLCSICFNEIGNQTDYIRMDRPASVRVPGRLYEPTIKIRQPSVPPHIFKRGALLKHAKPKLDSRFILDVNVIDGTMMAPSTAFTKIWRMRNNGTLVWPKGTQLVWIGGDQFSDTLFVDLEVPEDGVPMEKELDIAVDFRAPHLPGRYISYWRMASPCGHKFGQRVWVLIQVDASLKDSFYASSQGLNLNIPLDVSGSKGPRVIDINVQPIEDDTFHQPKSPNAPPEPVNQMVDKEPKQEQGNEFPTNEATFVGPAASPPATSVAPSSVSYPIIDFSSTASAIPFNQQASTVDAPSSYPAASPPATSVAPSSVSYPIIDFSSTASAVPFNQQASTVDAPSSYLGMGGSDVVEEALLKELEEMGFKQVDLNKEILRMNEYNLEQSVDDLCGASEWDPILEEEMGFKQVDLNKEILRMNEYNLEQSVDDLCGASEWDPILEELHEMGFLDKEMNKRLLRKNNGSIKRVVMDLINGE